MSSLIGKTGSYAAEGLGLTVTPSCDAYGVLAWGYN